MSGNLCLLNRSPAKVGRVCTNSSRDGRNKRAERRGNGSEMEEKEERERERVNVVTLYLRLEFLHSSRSVCTKYLRLIWIRHVSPTASKANFSARPIGAGIMGVLVKTSPRITWLKVLHARAHLPRKTEKNERKVGEKGKTRPLSRYVSIICIQCTNRDSIWIRSFPWLKRTASKKEKKKKINSIFFS